MDHRNPLEDWLDAYRSKPMPPLPPNLDTAVWRSIRAKQGTGQKSFIARWLGYFELLPQSEVFATALILAFVVGFSFSTTTQSPERVRHAMGLEVFSHDSYSPLAKIAYE